MQSMGLVLCRQKSHWQCAAIFLTLTVIFLANYCYVDMITDKYITSKKRSLRRKLEDAAGVLKKGDLSIEINNVGLHMEEHNKHPEALTHKDYSVYTPACKIPSAKVPPRKYNIINVTKKTRKCEKFSAVSQLIEGTREIKLRDELNARKSQCNISPIFRQRGNSFKLGRSITIAINGSIRAPSSTELLLTRCGKEFSIHTLFPVGQRLYWKTEYWKERRDSFPISYILLGFDSISRAQFHRSFPKTSDILQQLKFIHLRGYHSVSPYKFDNLAGLLSGMNMRELREECGGKSGRLSLDKCPFIWKNLNWNKYTTMYVDDTQQTFDNFIKKPTDFYPNIMFHVAQSLSKSVYRARPPCVSNISNQNYIVDYTKRFIRKFGKNPIFSLTWFSSTGKDSEEEHAVTEFDDNLAKFFMGLKSIKNLLERTMIIVLSDHEGHEGIEFPVKESYHSLLERSLPALFIRLPELLEERQPGLHVRKVLELNSRRLVTPFDLHHTILHSMVLTGADISEEVFLPEFQPFLIRKSSLLYPIRKDRNCKELNILSDSCICHVPGEAIEFKDLKMKEKMYNFAIRQINNLIAPYNHSCATFVKSLQPEILALALANGTNTTRVLLQFNVDPGNTKFETRLKFRHEHTKLQNLTRVGSFYRLNSLYKSCIPPVKNEQDRRRIAEMCICAPHVQGEVERQRRSSKKSRKQKW